jgi:PAS domain S-box-containing protein
MARKQRISLDGAASELLRKSDQRLSSILASITDCHFELDHGWRFIRINDQALAYFGRERAELIGQSYFEAFPTLEDSIFKEQYNKAVLHGASAQFTVKSVLYPGKWVELHVYPTEEGGVSVFFRDITEAKRAEIALRESEERFRAFMDNSPAIAWAKDEQGRHTYWNKTFEQRFHVRLEDWRGKTDFELWPSEIAEVFRQHDLTVLTAGQALDMVEKMIDPDGTYSWWWIFKFPFRDAAERRYVGGVGIDITERKRIEEKLRESENRFRAIADYSYDVEHWFDPDGKLLWVNPAVYRLTGYTVDECMAMPNYPLPLFEPNEKERIASHLAQAIEGSSANDVEFRIRRKDGSLKWVAASWQPIYDANGASLGHRSSIRDVTDRKWAEEKVQTLNEELQRLVMELKATNQYLKTISYSLSHDLRTSLVGIQGFSRRLLEKYAPHLDEKGKQYLRSISRSSTQMGELLSDLTTLLGLGPKKTRFSQVQIAGIVREIVDELREIHTERTIKWDIRTLPDANGDKTMLRQVFANLLGNAVKYSRPREPAVIEVGGWTANEKNVYYVKDNGVGFPAERADRIFKVFERLHTSEEFEGTGLGLAIVKRVGELHGGEVWAHSKVDEGAVFYFSIPA